MKLPFVLFMVFLPTLSSAAMLKVLLQRKQLYEALTNTYLHAGRQTPEV